MDPIWQKDNLLFTWNNNKYIYRDLKNITCKYIYSFRIDKKAKQASSEQSWNLYFQTNVDWSSVWIYQTTNLTGNMCLTEFNFKLLHNILPSGTLLYKWKLSNSGFKYVKFLMIMNICLFIAIMLNHFGQGLLYNI